MLVTNRKGNTLEDTLKNTYVKTKEACFLVGYFYYSGFAKIYQGLKDINMRVLVGLEAERDMANHVREIESIDYVSGESRNSIKDKYFRHFTDIFNNTEMFDSETALEAFDMFCNKIKNGTLSIRKTADPNHAKMYLLEYQDKFNSNGNEPGMIIVGSSNLSRAGLADRFEINNVSNGSDFVEGKEIFEELWDRAILLADKDNFDEFDRKVLDRIWYEKLYSPFLVYLNVLDKYFTLDIKDRILSPHDINNRYSDFKYQIDAVKMAVETINRHNGVIVADVVGLGKSIVASTVAANLHLDTIVIAPPHLVSQWEDYSSEFHISARVFSCGKIQDALDYFDAHADDSQKLIIIDEAHRYRNEETRDYMLLHTLCAGNKVMLLTATPFNNNPSDIYSMIKLFQIPSKSTLKTVDNLGQTFKELIKRYQKLKDNNSKNKLSDEDLKTEIESISKEIRGIIGPLVVRRSRLDLEAIKEYSQDLKRQKISFSVVRDPEALSYDLGNIEKKYVRTLERISPSGEEGDNDSYKAARYQIVNYVKEESEEDLAKYLEKQGVDIQLLFGTQSNLSKFMRRLLVRRFESSLYAFRSSLDNMIQNSREILNWVEDRGQMPIYKKGNLPDIDALSSMQGDDASDEVETVINQFKEKGMYEIPLKFIKPEFISDMRRDLEILQAIKGDWFGDCGKDVSSIDPKIRKFIDIIKKQLSSEPERKIIVFSEFADTARYVAKGLEEEGLRVFFYSGTNATSSSKNIIVKNFDAGIPKSQQLNDYDILVATDAISEGYSLHRAGAIYNYDIPYNPTRVIQRIGRINRINKKVFNELYIYNFFPSLVGEKDTRTKDIATLKMAMIQAIMGEDTRVLTADEDLNSFFLEKYNKEKGVLDTESWETKHRAVWSEYKDTELMQKARSIPHRARLARIDADRNGQLVVFGMKGMDYIFKSFKDGAVSVVYPEEALNIFRADCDEMSYKVSMGFYDNYDKLKKELFKEVGSDDKKNRLKALGLLNKAKIKAHGEFRDYLDDLIKVVELDALSTYELKDINSMSKSLEKLPERISQQFINRILHQVNDEDLKVESIILSEEFIGG